MRKLISTGSPFEKTAGYSRAVVDGDWCFVSGTTGYDYATMTMPEKVLKPPFMCGAISQRNGPPGAGPPERGAGAHETLATDLRAWRARAGSGLRSGLLSAACGDPRPSPAGAPPPLSRRTCRFCRGARHPVMGPQTVGLQPDDRPVPGGGPWRGRPPLPTRPYSPSCCFIMASTFFFTSSRLKEAGVCIGGYLTAVIASCPTYCWTSTNRQNSRA